MVGQTFKTNEGYDINTMKYLYDKYKTEIPYYLRMELLNLTKVSM